MREESSELEYISENEEEFRTPPLDLMTLVLEGGAHQGIYGSLPLMREEDSLHPVDHSPVCSCLHIAD